MPSPSTAIQTLSLPPLLDVTRTEKAQISASKLISGFSILSGATNFVNERIPGVSTVVQVSSVGGLGLVGVISGGVQAYYEITEEQSKAIKLNKELFFMFNVAADKLTAVREAKKKFAHDEKNITSLLLQEQYHEYISEIHARLSSAKSTQKEEKIEKLAHLNADEKHAPRALDRSPEHNRIHGIIREYVIHRRESNELKLWEALKHNNIYAQDAQLANFFVEFNSEEEVKNHFNQQRENERAEFLENMVNYRAILQAFTADNVAEKESLEKLTQLRADLINKLDHIHDGGNFHDKKDVHIRDHLKDLKQLHHNILNLLNEDSKHKLRHAASQLIDTLNSVSNNTANKRILLQDGITNTSNGIFGEEGSFRNFWRELPSKTYRPRNTEEISLNFEQNIYRGGKSLTAPTLGLAWAGTAVGLFYTGKGLYMTAVALGAAGMGTMGLGILVGALAIALALMCTYLYYKTAKIQDDRAQLYTRLNVGRSCLFVSERNAKPIMDIAARPVNDAVSSPAKGGVFRPTVVPLPEHKRGSDSLTVAIPAAQPASQAL